MNMRVAGGLTLLDCAKSAIENFIKARGRDIAGSRADRYMLVTCEEGPGALKAYDVFPFKAFQRALKVTRARDLTALGPALKRALDVLNLHRLAAGVDTYGNGLNPFNIDPATIILLTDGTELTSAQGATDILRLPMDPTPGSELTKEPFRWDQRLFSIVLKIAATGTAELGGAEGEQVATSLTPMCEVMGGKCTTVTSLKSLLQNMEVIAQRVSQPTVVVGYQRLPAPGSWGDGAGEQQTAWAPHILYTQRSQANHGLWPIPEAFWLDPGLARLPSREAQPTISFLPIEADPYIPPGFPVDKYDLEEVPMTALMSAAAQGSERGACWQVFVQNSKIRGEAGEPFGFLRLNRAATGVALYILPYNYPVLWKLLDQLAGLPPMKKLDPPSQWRGELERYISGIPPAYAASLRTAFKKMGVGSHVIPEVRDGGLGFPVSSYLHKLQLQAKKEVERLQEILAAQAAAAESVPRGPVGSAVGRGGLQALTTAGVFQNTFDVPR
eukprot:CAMPEP_0182909606 /NCGR_PEP_ID=MMETSP0034_2-20130328/35847_1 /TAXON_ID=156128 /ORGANISM="Nephroselmis pyriformis, Strain CCMP717" /LENGTH=498 /DNA_ID=CAMNT_0025045873 /DNA_START=57 /DNA_END=1549 /DNA_ORIENTATION=-